ncbi:beta-lactamase superfamily II metal-dependent hydrolase [Nitrosomonas oligotropha]|uniref:Beta-lactamase superfamily II metal-dependent hydrolase n=1 Tax=Nitrosomonas oligotropha TaxID=42354 RepID=A0A2T5HXY6_9PROT|nr:MBL fold metallo-hydrolase [Nitrosomonas oligotropha]PTQ76454.1 beta-lactamase superfamily II metal-dependent hydrolase [Nitrosomonas oligotropha]
MKLQIFDVEHGACALLTADNNTRLMIDCGHNALSNWKPGTYLKSHGILDLDMLAITNYDEDHASGANDLFDNINVKWLSRNPSVSKKIINILKSEDGKGPGIERLFDEIENTFTGNALSPEPYFEGLITRKLFYNSYPAFDDENNLSMAIFLKCHNTGVMFTGDLEKAGFSTLLRNEEFRKALGETNVYIASHHGRESGCSDEVAALLKNVYYVVISDKGYTYDTQETNPFYRNLAKGGIFRSEEKRFVLTTRNDGCINFKFTPDSWCPY